MAKKKKTGSRRRSARKKAARKGGAKKKAKARPTRRASGDGPRTRPGPPRSQPQPTLVTGTASLAAILGVHQTTVNRWIKAGMPRVAEATFDAPEALAWRDGRPGAAGGRRDPHDAEWRQWRARSLQLKVLKDLKKLIPRREAEAIWTRTIINVRTRLLALPERVALLVPTRLRADLRIEVRHEVDRILSELENGFLPEEIEAQVHAFIETLFPADADTDVTGPPP